MAVDVEPWTAALQSWAERTTEATQKAATDAAEHVRGAIQENLALRTYPPASPAGEPPAWRTGWLHEHVYVRVLPTETGWQARVYPSTVYARIQELSGWAGAGHRSFLPARPYVKPARDSSVPEIADTFTRAWRAARPGG